MLTITSPAFAPGGTIPLRYVSTGVAGGENVSIPYEWRGVPEGTKSLSLAVIDLAPVAHNWVHWLVVDIPPEDGTLPEGASAGGLSDGSKQLRGTAGRSGYFGPQPPAGSGPHEYRATLYALDVESVGLSEDSTFADFEHATAGHVLGTATYSGKFER